MCKFVFVSSTLRGTEPKFFVSVCVSECPRTAKFDGDWPVPNLRLPFPPSFAPLFPRTSPLLPSLTRHSPFSPLLLFPPVSRFLLPFSRARFGALPSQSPARARLSALPLPPIPFPFFSRPPPFSRAPPPPLVFLFCGAFFCPPPPPSSAPLFPRASSPLLCFRVFRSPHCIAVAHHEARIVLLRSFVRSPLAPPPPPCFPCLLPSPALFCARCKARVPTQFKATQPVVAIAAWATQRSDPDFNLSILLLNDASEQCYIAVG
jgi:hypothetical protein